MIHQDANGSVTQECIGGDEVREVKSQIKIAVLVTTNQTKTSMKVVVIV